MNQVSNSLLTPLLTPFKMSPYVWAPRDNAFTCGRHFTPFFASLGNALSSVAFSLGFSCPPRSLVRSRLGEGRIRNLFRGVLIFFLCTFLVWIAVPMTSAAEDLVIKLKEEAAVESETIHLKDIADLSGTDAERLEILANIPLRPAPAFGETSTMSRYQIGEAIEKTAGRLPPGAICGAAVVQIRLRGRPITEDDIASLLRAYITNRTSWDESEIVIRSIGNVKGIELPQKDSEVRLAASPAAVGQKNISIAVEILHANESLRTVWISAEISIRSKTLTAGRRIPSGKVITSDDIVEKNVEIPDLRASYLTRPDEVLGKVSRRIFSAGDPLTRESFAEPVLVKNGDTVRLRLERNGIVLTSLAKAEQDGRLGQVIRVRNIDFSALLRAKVTGKAEVEMP